MSLIEAMGKAVLEVESGVNPPPPPTPSLLPPAPPQNSKLSPNSPSPNKPIVSATVSGNMMGGAGDSDSSDSDDTDEDLDMNSEVNEEEDVKLIVYDTDSDEEVEYDETTEAGREAKVKAGVEREGRRRVRRKEAERREEEARKKVKEMKGDTRTEVGEGFGERKMNKKGSSNLTGLGSLGSNFGGGGGEQVLNPEGGGDKDEFGITYKPMKRNYELPTGLAFADEAEVRFYLIVCM